MGRADVDAHAGNGIPPAFLRLPAGKYERVQAVLVDDGQFEIATKRSACDRIPHPAIIARNVGPRFDLNHFFRAFEGLAPDARQARAIDLIWLNAGAASCCNMTA